MASSLDIILVNRSSGKLLRNCLGSIGEADKSSFTLNRVCVVDDASEDDSLKGIGDLGLPLQIRYNREHRGYGASCNLGAAGSNADYLLFLNTDTRLAYDSLRVPVRYLDNPENYQIGIVGVQLLDDSGEVKRCTARFPTVGRYYVMMLGLDRVFPRVFLGHQMKEWDHLSTREVDQVMGAFMMMRRAIFEQLGGYDERFFVYMEDLDLSLRARQLGFKSLYLSSAYAYHQGGGTSEKVRAESVFFSLRSRIQYGFKHFTFWGALMLMLGTALIELLPRIVWGFTQRSIYEVGWTLQAYGRLWYWLPSFLRGSGGYFKQ